jgi:hypothetical protein
MNRFTFRDVGYVILIAHWVIESAQPQPFMFGEVVDIAVALIAAAIWMRGRER